MVLALNTVTRRCSTGCIHRSELVEVGARASKPLPRWSSKCIGSRIDPPSCREIPINQRQVRTLTRAGKRKKMKNTETRKQGKGS